MVGDLLAALVCVVCLSVHGAVEVRGVQGRRAFDRHFFRARLERCTAYCQHLVARARKGLVRQPSPDGKKSIVEEVMDACVADAVHLHRERLARGGLRILSRLMFVNLVFTIYNVIAGSSWMTTPQIAICCVIHMLCLFMQHRPRQHSVGVLRAFFAFLLVGAGFGQLMGPHDILVLLFMNGGITPLRFFASVLMMDPAFVCLVNLLFSVTFCAAVYQMELKPADMLPLTCNHFLGMELSILAGIVCSSHAYQQITLLCSQHAIEAKASSSEKFAAVKVLSRMCDAVVQLDDQLRVADEETKLAAFLLHGPGRTLTGSDFLHYLQAEGGHHSFRAWLKAPLDNLDETAGFQAKLRDSAGNAILVDMFHVPFEKAPGALHHFIGIREKTADGLIEGRPDPNNVSTGHAERHREQASGDSVLSGSSTEAEDDDAVIQEVDGHPVIKFDSSSFKVIGCSLGFSIGRDGPLKPGTCLADRLKKCEVNTNFFSDYVMEVTKLIARARDSPDPVEAELPATIVYTPKSSLDTFQLNVKMTCRSSWLVHTDRLDAYCAPAIVVTAVILESIAHEPRSSSASSSSLSPLRESGHLDSLRPSLRVSL